MVVDVKASFAKFIYPFSFDPGTYPQRVAGAMAAQWSEGEEKVWKTRSVKQDALLPHVTLFDDNHSKVAWAGQMRREAANAPWGLGFGSDHDWILNTRAHGDQSRVHEPIRLGWEPPELFLFRSGIGLAVLTVRPLAEPVRGMGSDGLETAAGSAGRGQSKFSNDPIAWWRLLHYFRYTNHADVTLSVKGHAGNPPPRLGAVNRGDSVIARLVDCVVQTARQSKAEAGWSQPLYVRDQLLVYAGLWLDGVPEYKSQLLLARFRGFHDTSQELSLSPTDRIEDHPALVPNGERQWHVCTLQGGGFIGFDVPKTRFHRREFPKQMREVAYYTLFILAMQQRFSLMALSTDVAIDDLLDYTGMASEDHQGHLKDRREACSRLQRRLGQYLARQHFSQVMQIERHHRVYRRWLDVCEVHEALQEVRDEISLLHDQVQSDMEEARREIAEEQNKLALEQAERVEAQDERHKALERRIAALAIPFGVASMVTGFLGINMREITAQDEGMGLLPTLLWCIAGTVFGSYLTWRWLERQRSRAAHAPADPPTDPAAETKPPGEPSGGGGRGQLGGCCTLLTSLWRGD